MEALSSLELAVKKDNLIFNFFATKCCSEEYKIVKKILSYLYELDSISSSTTREALDAEYNTYVEDTIKSYCKEKLEPKDYIVEYSDIAKYGIDFFCSNYNKITRTNNDVCFCDLGKATIANIILSKNGEYPESNYQDIDTNLSVETLSYITKFQ